MGSKDRCAELTMAYLSDAYAIAEELGLYVVEPKVNELQIDLDSPQDQYVMEALIALFGERGFSIRVQKVEHSRHGNKHATLLVNHERGITTMERIALQAILGSDRKREALGFLLAWDEIEPASVFFEEKAPQLVVPAVVDDEVPF